MPEYGGSGLDRIEHVVALMLENRSFDHMLGYLRLDGGRQDIEGLRPEMANRYDERSCRLTVAAGLGEPRPAFDKSRLVQWVAERHGARATRLLSDPAGMLRPAEAHALADLQERIAAVDQAVRDQGYPAGQP